MQDREALGSVAVPGLVARALEASQMTDAVLDAKPEEPLPPYVHQPHTPREAEAEAEVERDECPGREPPSTALEHASEPAAAQGTQVAQGTPSETARRRPPCAKRAAPPPCSPPPPPSLSAGLSVQAACLAAASAVAVAALLVAASRRGRGE